MKKRLLFVDDEKNILSSLRRIFIDGVYDVSYAVGSTEAVKLMSEQQFDMVVSDMRMPDLDGYGLLQLVATVQPSAIRVILSGYADKKTILRAIADGTAKAYLTKPWDNDKLRNDLQKLFSVYDTIRKDVHLEIVGRINKLPVLPQIYHELIRLIQEDADIDRIVSHLEQDAGYVAKLLAIVNSCLYGVSIGSIRQAVVYLGLDTVKNMVLSSDVFDVFRSSAPYKEEIDNIWRHSSLMSVLLHRIYQAVNGKKIPEEYATTGPLHDIGMLLMLQYFPVEYSIVKEQSLKEPDKPIAEIEQSILGISHTVMGGYLLDFWNLPYYLVEGCLYHHDPFSSNVHEKQIMAITNLADTVSWNTINNREPLTNISSELLELAGIKDRSIINDLSNMLDS